MAEAEGLAEMMMDTVSVTTPVAVVDAELLVAEAETGDTTTLLPIVMISSVQVSVVVLLALPETGPTSTPLVVELAITGMVRDGDAEVSEAVMAPTSTPLDVDVELLLVLLLALLETGLTS